MAICGCSRVPPAQLTGIASTSSKLVLHDSTGHLRTFDSKNEEWSSRISYPEMSYSSSKVTPSLNLIRSCDNHVIINILQGDRNYIYKYTDSNGLQIEGKITGGRLTGFDDEYYYINNIKTLINIPKVEYIPSNYRINKTTGENIEFHFSEYPDLIVLDTLKQNGKFYYLAVDKEYLDPKDDRHGMAYGTIYMLMTNNNKLEKCIISETKDISYSLVNPANLAQFIPFSGSKVTFRVPTKFSGSKICNYDGAIKCTSAFTDMRSYQSYKAVPISNGNTNNLAWDLATGSPRTIQGVNINTGERIYLNPPDKINLLFSPNTNTHISNSYLWSGGYTFRSFVGDMPYLIRFSPTDGSSRAYALEPGFFEGVETVFYNFLRYLHPVTYLGPG